MKRGFYVQIVCIKSEIDQIVNAIDQIVKGKKGNKYNLMLYSKFAHNYARLQSKLDHNCATNLKSAATKENDKYNLLSYPKLLTVASDYNQNCTITVLQSPYLNCFENCFKS